MDEVRSQVIKLFQELDRRIGDLNLGRRLVSKAVKAPEKNRQLLRQAIASGEFPTLVDRILKHGGRLEDFT